MPNTHLPTIHAALFMRLPALQSLCAQDLAYYTFAELECDITPLTAGIMTQLSKEIVVPESKLRWLQEQRRRLVVSTEVFSTINLPQITPAFFCEVYNHIIWDMVELSQGKLAGNIRGIPSTMEETLQQEARPQPHGLPALKAKTSENGNIFNQLMRWVHSC